MIKNPQIAKQVLDIILESRKIDNRSAEVQDIIKFMPTSSRNLNESDEMAAANFCSVHYSDPVMERKILTIASLSSQLDTALADLKTLIAPTDNFLDEIRALIATTSDHKKFEFVDGVQLTVRFVSFGKLRDGRRLLCEDGSSLIVSSGDDAYGCPKADIRYNRKKTGLFKKPPLSEYTEEELLVESAIAAYKKA